MAGILPFASGDAGILDRIRMGDEGALEDLYRGNRRAIRALIRRNGGREEDAEDILQEALVTLWERVRSGRFQLTARPGTFLFAVARNMWLRRLARARREVKDPDIDTAHGDASPIELLVEQEEAEIVARAMGELGETCRKLLLLFYWEEKTMAEIAAELGMANADTVKARKYQCKRTLEALLKGRIPGYG
jgi:RNA polymerase sigma factor (sigma-70 family)